MNDVSIEEMVDDLRRLGVSRVHSFAWRDLDDPDAGGSEVHLEECERRWASAGLEVVHHTSTVPGLPDRTVRSGYEVVRRGGRYSVFPRLAFAEVSRRLGPSDALIEVWNGVPWMSPLWYRRPRLVILHHVHGPMWGQLFPKPVAALGRALEARVAPPCYRRTTIVTPSDGTRDELLELGLHAERVVTVPNGVHPRFSVGGRKTTQPSVLAVGRLAPVKRFDAVIRALCEARVHVPTVSLTIVGDGPQRDELRSLVEQLGASDWIHLVGRLDDAALVQAYQRAWIVVSGSIAEGWGLSLTEAAACGTTAVATDIAGHRSAVEADVSGILTDIEHLGSAVADLLIDHNRRSTLERNAVQRASVLSWDQTAQGVLALLRSEVAARSGGATEPLVGGQAADEV